MGRGASGAGARGGSFDLAARLPFALAALLLRFGALALRLREAPRRVLTTLRLRAGAAFLALRPFLFALLALRFFAIIASRWFR
jgi:hypothetical protein